MATDFSEILLTDAPLRVPPHALTPTAGAVVDFLGVVRGLEESEKIAGLDYEAHAEMARHQLAEIAGAARSRFGLERVVLHHRVGFVAAAEASLFLRVSAAHRQPALEGCAWIVERLKQLAPIWKHPVAQ